MEILHAYKKKRPPSVIYIIAFDEEEIEVEPLLELFREGYTNRFEDVDATNVTFHSVVAQSRDGLNNNRRVIGVQVRGDHSYLFIQFDNRTYDLNEFLKEGHRDIGLTPEEAEEILNR